MKPIPNTLNRLVDLLSLAFSRLGVAGLSPVMPGTCGSAVAAALAPFIFMPLGYAARACVLILVFIAGSLAATRAEKLLGKKDPGQVVIDELLGQWLAYLPFSTLAPWEYIAGFILFRIFDISKPWPVRNLEKLPSGWGIMADDAAAGAYAMLALEIIRRLTALTMGA